MESDEATTKDAMVKKALKWTGGSYFLKSPPKITRVRADQCIIPFLRKQVIGDELYRVELDDYNVQIDTAEGRKTNPFVSKLLVLVDPLSGRILEIRSAWASGSPPIAPEPPVEEYERQLLACGQRYDGVPDSPPKISLATALQVIHDHGCGEPLGAKMIVARYVLFTGPQCRNRKVWAVDLRGIPPLGVSRLGEGWVPVEARDHIRNLLDADTGEWFRANTVPQPVQGLPAGDDKQHGE